MRATGAAAVVLLALAIVPAPLLPPLGAAAKLQAAFGIGWKPAYLVTTLGLHAVLYGSLGLVAAFAVRRGDTFRGRLARLVIVPLAVVGITVAVRSLKLGHVPVLANAVVPMAACALGAATGSVFRQHGWRVALGAVAVLSAGLLWSFFPGTPSELSRATELQLRQLVEASHGLPSGEERFGALLEAAFAPLPSAPARLSAVDHNRAAILALGVALGHERLARYAGLDREAALVRSATALRAGATLRGREDWVRHYCVSAALAVMEGPLTSDAGGLIKEELDALTRGSGFSFGDLAADRAGVWFARAATGSEKAALAMQARLRDGYSVDHFFPPVSDLPEDLTVEQFRREYGGVGSRSYRRVVREIEMRLGRCPGLAPS